MLISRCDVCGEEEEFSGYADMDDRCSHRRWRDKEAVCTDCRCVLDKIYAEYTTKLRIKLDAATEKYIAARKK